MENPDSQELFAELNLEDISPFQQIDSIPNNLLSFFENKDEEKSNQNEDVEVVVASKGSNVNATQIRGKGSYKILLKTTSTKEPQVEAKYALWHEEDGFVRSSFPVCDLSKPTSSLDPNNKFTIFTFNIIGPQLSSQIPAFKNYPTKYYVPVIILQVTIENIQRYLVANWGTFKRFDSHRIQIEKHVRSQDISIIFIEGSPSNHKRKHTDMETSGNSNSNSDEVKKISPNSSKDFNQQPASLIGNFNGNNLSYQVDVVLHISELDIPYYNIESYGCDAHSLDVILPAVSSFSSLIIPTLGREIEASVHVTSKSGKLKLKETQNFYYCCNGSYFEEKMKKILHSKRQRDDSWSPKSSPNSDSNSNESSDSSFNFDCQNLLHLAVLWKSMENLSKFLESSEIIFINQQDRYGCTALHYAAQQDKADMVDLLLKYGASPRIKDAVGKYPVDVALEVKAMNAYNKLCSFMETVEEDEEMGTWDSWEDALEEMELSKDEINGDSNNNRSSVPENNLVKYLGFNLSLLIDNETKKNQSKNPFDVYLPEVYHFHTGEDIKVGGSGKYKSNNTVFYRFWSAYSESLRAESSPKLEIEFSQNLDTELTVLPKREFGNATPIAQRGIDPREKIVNMMKLFRGKSPKLLSKDSVETTFFDLLWKQFEYQCKIYNNKMPIFPHEILETILDLYSHFESHLSGYHKEQINKILNSLNFRLDPKTSGNTASIQLQYLGTRMLHKQQPTYRSDLSFYPDGWQDKVLNIISARKKSALIIAPTSSGKSYLSLKAIKMVLSENKNVKQNRNIMKSQVVVVSPTLSLVNQMAATIYSSFPTDFGIFTREWRKNENSCKILICTPYEFVVLLMSPQNQEWVKNMKYVILDEVQTISNYEDISPHYVKILSLITCPFIALSATISNGDQFAKWLRSLRKEEVEVIPDPKDNMRRWVDLHLHFYDAEKSEIHPLHPVSLLPEKSNALDIGYLSPIESLQFYNIMASIVKNCEYLKPEKFFEKKMRITRNDQSEYSDALLKFYQNLEMKEKKLIKKQLQKFEVPEDESGDLKDIDALLKRLYANNMAPAILFHIDMEGSVDLYQILQDLAKKYEPSLSTEIPKERKEVLPEKSKKKDLLREEKKADLLKVNITKRELRDLAAKEKVNNWKAMASSGKGTFANWTQIIDKSDFWLQRLFAKVGWSYKYYLMVSLAYGVGFHDESLPKPYRDFVEFAFRSGAISFVFSTRSLVMGVNMPVKSVVFLKEDLKNLSLSAYRQISGRAGRRGHDNIGHVIFYGFRKTTIQRLHFGSLENLDTASPLDLTCVLKAMILADAVKGKPEEDEVLKRLSRLLHPPLNSSISDSNENNEAEVQKFKLSLELLYSLNLIDESGKPIGLAALAAHTPEIFPANFLLAYVIGSNKLDFITKPFAENSSVSDKNEAEKSLVNLLAHVMLRIEDKSEGQAFLPPLSNEMMSLIQDYNAIVNSMNQKYKDASFPEIVKSKKQYSAWMYHLFCHRKWSSTIFDCQIPDWSLYIKTDVLISALKKILTVLNKLSTQEKVKNIVSPWSKIFSSLLEKFKELKESSSNLYKAK